MVRAKDHPYFTTVTCLEWKHVLKSPRVKKIILDSLDFLTRDQRVSVYAFCLMDNHIHMIWQMLGDHKLEHVQRDFLKFTGQQILAHLRKEKSALLSALLVNTSDRKYQVWERNCLSIPLWSPHVFHQKLNYIHRNPVAAGLCTFPDDYFYSSAGFYYTNLKTFDFLEHYDG